jgi:hypothetical protein
MQMLQEEIIALKKNLTDANVKQIEEKEKSIADKKNALEKHCRHLSMTYGKYGSQENGHEPENTNGEVSTVTKCLYINTNIPSRQTGGMINGDVKNGHASTDVVMDDVSTAVPTNSADAASSAALDEIQFPQPAAPDVTNGFDVHHEIDMATSYNAIAGVDNNDPFITPAGHVTTDFHAPTGTYVDPFGPRPDALAQAFINNDGLYDQSVDRTGSGPQCVIDVDDFLRENDGVMPTNYSTSAGHVGDHGTGLGRDYEMDMDAMVPRAPITEHDESLISSMDK